MLPKNLTACKTCGFVRDISHEAIKKLAYLKWEAAGRPEGQGDCFWAEAERECPFCVKHAQETA